MRKTKKTITLMELIIVVVLIGILSMAGVVGYRQTVLRARDREAQAMLRLIKNAAEVWRLEMGGYINPNPPPGLFQPSITCANTAACNAVLRLSLPDPAAADAVWRYRVQALSANSFCAEAMPGPAGEGLGFHIRRNVATGLDESNQNPLPPGGC